MDSENQKYDKKYMEYIFSVSHTLLLIMLTVYISKKSRKLMEKNEKFENVVFHIISLCMDGWRVDPIEKVISINFDSFYKILLQLCFWCFAESFATIFTSK